MKELIKELQNWLEDKPNTKFEITEEFSNIHDTYIVHNLMMEYEEDFIMFYDADNIIFNKDKTVMRCFLEGSIKEISIEPEWFQISFGTGCVWVKKIK